MNEKLSYLECVSLIDALLYAHRHGFKSSGTGDALIKLLCMRDDALKSEKDNEIIDRV